MKSERAVRVLGGVGGSAANAIQFGGFGRLRQDVEVSYFREDVMQKGSS